MRPFWILAKMASMQRLYSLVKLISLGQKIKLPKTYQKRIYKYIIVILCKKKPLENTNSMQKTSNIREMRPFWILAKMASVQRLYSLVKIISLGQKIKLPKTYQKRIYMHIILILCKKLFEKTPNIRKIRPFWILAKMASMQRL